MSHSRHQHRLRASKRPNGGPALRWHRRIGLALAAIFLVVCATGFLLNHAEGLGLHRVPLRAPWLYRWYGMQAKSEPIAYPCADRHAIWLEGSLYLDSKSLTRLGELRGAVALEQAWIAAASREIVLFTPEGEVIERLGDSALPPDDIVRVGVSAEVGQTLVAQTNAGRVYEFDPDFVSYKELPAALVPSIAWSQRGPLSPELRDEVLAAYRGEGLTMHRLVLDLHSGRFFGRAGVYVVDAAAVGLLFLTLSGVYSALWGRRRQP